LGIWRLSTERVAALLANLHVAMTALLHLELLHKNKPQRKHIPDQAGYPFQKLIEGILSGTASRALPLTFGFRPQRDAYMLDIVGNTVCADLLDYAKRDSHFANLKLDYDAERIAENFTLISWNAVTYPGGKEMTVGMLEFRAILLVVPAFARLSGSSPISCGRMSSAN